MRSLYRFFLISLVLMPGFAFAQIVINEIAWMGTMESANDEWIELFNMGDEVDLTDWMLVTDDESISITLSGVLSSGEYLLLERTDDTSVPQESADMIYSGGLPNTGKTLIVKDSSGLEIDRVVGGENWETIGGNNTTKHTAQRQNDNSWITGEPTPKRENTTVDTGADTGTGGTGSSSSKPPASSGATVGYRQNIFAYAGEDRTVVVGADTLFEGYLVGRNGKKIGTGHYEWSFGDGGRRSGRRAMYAYEYPGEYRVRLRVRSQDQKNDAEVTVTAVLSDVSIIDADSSANGYITLHNNAPYELNLSEWRLVAKKDEGSIRSRRFTIPEGTSILPEQEVRFPHAVTHLDFATTSVVWLEYPNGNLVTKYDLSEQHVQSNEHEKMSTSTETVLRETEVSRNFEISDIPKVPEYTASLASGITYNESSSTEKNEDMSAEQLQATTSEVGTVLGTTTKIVLSGNARSDETDPDSTTMRFMISIVILIASGVVVYIISRAGRSDIEKIVDEIEIIH